MNADKIKELRSLIEEERLARAGYDCSPGTESWGRVCSVQAAAKAAAYAELPALLDEVEALTEKVWRATNAASGEALANDALRQEVRALTADAERYRFIRDGKSRGDVDLCICIAHWTEEPVLYSVRTQERADAAIDAARHEPKDAELSQSVSAYDPKRDDWHEGEQND